MGPDFYGKQKTKKNFHQSDEKGQEKILTFLRYTKKIKKKGSQIQCHKTSLQLSGKKDKKNYQKRGSQTKPQQ